MSILNTLDQLKQDYENTVLNTVKEYLSQFCTLLKDTEIKKNKIYFDFSFNDYYDVVMYDGNIIFSTEEYNDIDLENGESYSTNYHGKAYESQYLNEHEKIIMQELINKDVFSVLERLTDIINFNEDGYIQITQEGIFFKIK